MNSLKIAVLGLGFVGLQLALELAKHFNVIGYDVNSARIDQLLKHLDANFEFSTQDLASSRLVLTYHLKDLQQANVFIICVPTPLHHNHQPDLSLVQKVSATLASLIKPQDIVIYESSVYPKATESLCIPILEHGSMLKEGQDFFVAYSPERINPGDKAHRLNKIIKLIAAPHPLSLEVVKRIYQAVCKDVYICSSIAVAEASKILENCQRDVNIALMNEFTTLMHKLDIPMQEVIDAASSKYNFIPFQPGLVGGHCIPVDPHYIIFQAQEQGIELKLLKAARNINDTMTQFILQQIPNKHQGLHLGIFGLSYKPNVPDIRNSLVLKLLEEAKKYSFKISIHDPIVHSNHLNQHQLQAFDAIKNLDIIMIFVAHDFYINQGLASFTKKMNKDGLLMDIGQCFSQVSMPSNLNYWQL